MPVATALRRLLGSLLILEALGTGIWVANVVPMLAAIGAVAVAMLIARMLVGALQFVSGWLLFAGRPPATTLAIAALGLSAALVVLEFGFRLAPIDQDPEYRWLIAGVYGAYSAGWIGWLVSRSARPNGL
jgi:hypothetical protein